MLFCFNPEKQLHEDTCLHQVPVCIIVYFSLYLFLSYCLTYAMLTRPSERDRSKCPHYRVQSAAFFRPMNCPQQDTHPVHHCLVNLVQFGFVLLTSPYTCNWQNHSSPKYSILDTVFPRISIILKRPAHFLKQYGYKGRDPFNQNFRKFRSKTQWIGSVQLEKFRKKMDQFSRSKFWLNGLCPRKTSFLLPLYFSLFRLRLSQNQYGRIVSFPLSHIF